LIGQQLQEIIDLIEQKNAIHAKKIRKNLLGVDDLFHEKSDKFLTKYKSLINAQGQDLNYSIDCYLNMVHDMMYEQIRFMESGTYSCSSSEEANERVYSNPDVMEYYMHGLLISQFLFKHHYQMFEFFLEKFQENCSNVKSYLEVGAGHGLFLDEAISMMSDEAKIDVVDISQTSIDLTKLFIDDKKVQYKVSDIFNYEENVLYDFITMGEVLEHVEDPARLLGKLRTLLKNDGRVFITVPANSPVIDHIYLFRNAKEIQELIEKCGFFIVDEHSIYVEDVSKKKAEKFKVTMMYGALLKKRSDH
jgi:2-polyprenyl-3-methyl-5-hydroxy-6-metoxy-1,4-benzoquinol methylase